MRSEAYDKAKIEKLEVDAYQVPTDLHESDGTLKWDSTTMVLVRIEATGNKGIGYTYADLSTAVFIEKSLKPLLLGENAWDISFLFDKMQSSFRNNGNAGITFMGLSAVDIALWDLKARLLKLPLATLLGRAHESIQVYGSGGFTSYSEKELSNQLESWVAMGLEQVKIKIGRNPGQDINRIKVAREAIGPQTELFVDANGAYNVKQSLEKASEFQQYGVKWFEEPVSSDNLVGLSFIREKVPAGINIAAGEYGYDIPYFREMLKQQAVDVLQADASRCGGITGFLKAGQLAGAFQLPFSFHCAPTIHLHAALSLPGFFTGEYFHDHVRIEKMFFDGFREPDKGYLVPDLERPGLGVEFKIPDAKPFKIT